MLPMKDCNLLLSFHFSALCLSKDNKKLKTCPLKQHQAMDLFQSYKVNKINNASQAATALVLLAKYPQVHKEREHVQELVTV